MPEVDSKILDILVVEVEEAYNAVYFTDEEHRKILDITGENLKDS